MNLKVYLLYDLTDRNKVILADLHQARSNFDTYATKWIAEGDNRTTWEDYGYDGERLYRVGVCADPPPTYWHDIPNRWTPRDWDNDPKGYPALDILQFEIDREAFYVEVKG